MRKIFFAFFFFLFLFFCIIPLSVGKTFAACDFVTGYGCTYCVDNAGTCMVDSSRSTCPSGEYPDAGYCVDLGGGCPTAPGPCSATSTCGHNTDPCSGPGAGTCCSGENLVCQGGSCAIQTLCVISGAVCTGISTQGNCCDITQICDYYGGSTTLTCGTPQTLLGYACDMFSHVCVPCYDTSQTGCNPPQYDPGSYNTCDAACKGTIPTRFNCLNGDCTPAQNGSYSDYLTCKQNCSPTSPYDYKYDYSYSGLRFSNLEAVLAPVAKILFYASLVVGVLLIIYSGYALMTSEGNPQKVQQSQEQLTAAILGIIFILLSAAILRVIINSILVA